MPTYGYECPNCGHEYESFQKITDETLAACPECGTPGERVISGGAGLVFKGSGFYITDYARSGDKDRGDSDAGTPEKKDGGTPKKKDASAPSKPSEQSKRPKKGDDS